MKQVIYSTIAREFDVGRALLPVAGQQTGWSTRAAAICGRHFLSIVVVLVMALCSATALAQTNRDRPRQARQPKTPDNVTAHRDLEYASVGEKSLLLDVFVPKEVETPPLLVWIHGGGWRNGNKGNGGRFLPLTGQGYAVASINYRLSGEAKFPAQIHDCKAAIRWLRAQAKKYGYNASRIGVGGSSAGGHLVALLGTSGSNMQLEGEVGGNLDQSSKVQAVCDMWGPTDFLQMDAHAVPGARLVHNSALSPESLLIGGAIQENRDKVAAANPVTYIDKDDPPFLILHGDEDPAVPVHQSHLLNEALRQSGVEVKLHVVEGAGHGGREFAAPEINRMIAGFFAKHIRSRSRKTSGEGGESRSLATSATSKSGSHSSNGTNALFDGKPKTFVVNGYSTSFHWPDILQRKLDRYFDGKRAIEVKRATNGGTPIAKWMNVETSQPRTVWTEKLTPLLREKQHATIVLAQQSLQWVFGDRSAGIRSVRDEDNITIGTAAIRKYADLLLKDGADEVFIAMHIYKNGMEPQIGNERLALNEFLKSQPKRVYSGPDVWEPTSKVWPQAFRADKVHPNEIGAEIMAHQWFATLLTHDGRDVPRWSEEEMLTAMKAGGVSVAATTPDAPQSPTRQPPQQRRQPRSNIDRVKANDKNGDGKITKEEASHVLLRFFDNWDTNGDGVIDEAELKARAGRPRSQQTPQPNDPASENSRGEAEDSSRNVPDGVKWIPNIAYREGNDAWRLDLSLPDKRGAGANDPRSRIRKNSGDSGEGQDPEVLRVRLQNSELSGDTPRPAIVFVHGGGWRSGDKGSGAFRSLPLQFAAKGYVCISVNYRLTGEAPFPACFDDVRCAVRWLRANAKKYNVDPDRIGAHGNSAGAHLVALLGLVGPDAKLDSDGPYQDQSSLVQAVCPAAFPADFENWPGGVRQKTSIMALLAGREETLTDRIRQASPATYVSDKAPPFLIIQGTNDAVTPVAQVDEFVKAFETLKPDGIKYLRIEDAGHGVFSQQAEETHPAMEEFFERTIGRRTDDDHADNPRRNGEPRKP